MSSGKASGEVGNEHQSKERQQQQRGTGDEQKWRTEEPMHTKATQEQIEAAPNGTLAHRNYLCEALSGDRAKYAPEAMVQTAKNQPSDNLALERALHPSIAHTVPPPAVDATFQWHVAPPGGTFLGKVYTDGSRLDGPSPLMARNGWGFVVLNDDNVIIASASGLPPEWVDDIPATEA